jgi:hypothetical protein
MNPNDSNHEFGRFLRNNVNSDVPPEVEARLRRHLVAFREKMDSAQAERRQRAGIIAALFLPWRRAIAYAVPVAAIAIIGAVLAITSGGFHPAKAYAQAVEQMRKARTMTYTMILPQSGIMRMPPRMEFCYKEPGLSRQTLIHQTWLAGIMQTVAIVDLTQKKGIILTSGTKECTELDFSQMPSDMVQVNIIDEMRKIPTRATEVLGQHVLDGRTVQDYRVTTEGLDTIISVDVQTGNIARMEGKFINAPGMNVVMSDFRFDVELDDSLFDLTPPEGYRKVTVPVNVGIPAEDDLIYFLRWWAEHNLATAFPPSLHLKELQAKVVEMMISGELVGDKETTSREQLVHQQSLRMTQGIMFLLRMAPENDWHYAGENVKYGAADKAIFWYKPTGKPTYRVIYGDLTVRDVAPGDLPTTATASKP